VNFFRILCFKIRNFIKQIENMSDFSATQLPIWLHVDAKARMDQRFQEIQDTAVHPEGYTQCYVEGVGVVRRYFNATGPGDFLYLTNTGPLQFVAGTRLPLTPFPQRG
jgi:hypothetical protein